MANYVCNKDKNIVRFVDTDTNKFWTLDINTGVFTSSSGNAVKRFPVGFGKWLDDERYRNGANPIVKLMGAVRNSPHYYGIFDGYTLNNPRAYVSIAALFQIVDKLTSIGYNNYEWRNGFNIEHLTFVNNNFKTFAKWYLDHPNSGISDFMENYAVQIFCKENGINLDHMTEEMLGFIHSYIMRPSYGYELVAEKKYIPYTIYFISRGVIEFCGPSFAAERMNRMYKRCEAMEIMPTKSDFYRQYVDIEKTYQTNKAKYDAARLVTNYNEHRNALAYENDAFKVIIPETVEQFRAEAKYQHNCVYNMYLPKCINHDTHVVFIRRKNDIDTPYITCEVNKDGRINQYLTRYNSDVFDADACEFYQEYRDWIAKNW